MIGCTQKCSSYPFGNKTNARCSTLEPPPLGAEGHIELAERGKDANALRVDSHLPNLLHFFQQMCLDTHSTHPQRACCPLLPCHLHRRHWPTALGSHNIRFPESRDCLNPADPAEMTFARGCGFCEYKWAPNRRLSSGDLALSGFYPGACALDPLTTLSHVP
jgi:hypothetical protein